MSTCLHVWWFVLACTFRYGGGIGDVAIEKLADELHAGGTGNDVEEIHLRWNNLGRALSLFFSPYSLTTLTVGSESARMVPSPPLWVHRVSFNAFKLTDVCDHLQDRKVRLT